MLEKIIEEAQKMRTLLNQAISLFERDFGNLKIKAQEDFDAFCNKFSTLNNTFKIDSEATLEDFRKRLSDIVRDHQEVLKTLTKDHIVDSSEQIREQIEKYYQDIENEAKKKADLYFEKDLKELFNKYGDSIIPLFFKALIKFIFKPFRHIYPFS